MKDTINPTSLDLILAACPEHVGSCGVRINHGDSPLCSGISKHGDNYVAWSVVKRGDNYVALAGVCTILSGEYHVTDPDRIQDALAQAIQDVTKHNPVTTQVCGDTP